MDKRARGVPSYYLSSSLVLFSCLTLGGLVPEDPSAAAGTRAEILSMRKDLLELDKDGIYMGGREVTIDANRLKTLALKPDHLRGKLTFLSDPRNASAVLAARELRRTALKAGDVQRLGRDGAEMVFVPEGTIMMGDTHGDGDPDEKPTHQVTLSAFWIDRTEVTNAQFAVFVQAGNSAQGDWQKYAKGKDQHPVVNVTWHDALAYCRWARKRLPTEAEWEYAARGTDGRKYPWGNTWEDTQARFSGNRGNETTAPVGSYPTGASPFGVLDLAGNVWEWVQDWFGPYPGGAVRNPTGPSNGAWRLIRGGSWNLVPGVLRSSNRAWFVPEYRSISLGFRCVQGVANQG